MPVPNNTPATATEILVSLLPYVTTENVLDGTIQTVYFKITNDLTHDVVVTFWFHGVNVPGNPGVDYISDYEGFEEVGIINMIFDAYPNCATEVPIPAGASWWIRVSPEGVGATNPTLNINVTLKPYSTTFPAGQIVIFAASASGYFASHGGLHAGFIDPALGQIVNFIPFFPAAEHGDALANTGVYLITDVSAVTLPPVVGSDVMLLYNPQFQLVTRVLFPFPGVGSTFDTLIRTNLVTNKFWVVSPGFGGALNRYATVSGSGVISAPIDILAFTTGAAVAACAAATNTESHLLVAPRASSNNYLHKWNLNTLAWDGTIGTEVLNYTPSDVLMLADNTVVVSYLRDADKKDTIIRRYDLAGVQLNTVSIATANRITATPRLGYARDTAYFWAWLPQNNGVSLLKKFKASDFTLAIDTTIPNVYETSIETATPALIYVSDSCPIIETQVQSSASIFKIVPDKRTDSDGSNTIAIPAPTFKTALLP